LPFTVLACLTSITEASVLRKTSPDNVEAEVKTAEVVVKGDQVHISPELEPPSDKTFFKKDYPHDKRPVADPFHFKHPYPVVQDSGDFDRDYVKDENSDNGNWKAQETYDKLRAKLAKEKRDLAVALEKKHREEEELAVAKKQHQEEGLQKDVAEKKADALRKRKAERAERKKHSTGGTKGKGESSAGKAASVAESKEEEVDDATENTKDAVDSLEDCKKQLAEARKRLKEVMKELEEAKAAQEKTDAAADAAAKKELAAAQSTSSVRKQVDLEHDEYQAAKTKFDKAEAELKEYEAQMKVAEAKVQRMRDAEDKDGGVYPAPTQKSSVEIASSPRMLLLSFCVGLLANGLF